MILEKGLEQEGFVVDSIGEAGSVLANYEPGKYDLLIIDIKMPGCLDLSCTGELES